MNNNKHVRNYYQDQVKTGIVTRQLNNKFNMPHRISIKNLKFFNLFAKFATCSTKI